MFVGENLVLTAAHNVDDVDGAVVELLVRIHGSAAGKEEHPATIRLVGNRETLDLALLEVEGTSVSVPPLRFAEVNRDDGGLVTDCRAIGFPLFKELEHEPKPLRVTVQVDGTIPTAENLDQQLLTLKVSGSPPRPLAPTETSRSEWSGMSGAVVFVADTILIGVITEHHLPEGDGALTVVPITALNALLTPEVTAEWWRLLGLDKGAGVRLPPAAGVEVLTSKEVTELVRLWPLPAVGAVDPFDTELTFPSEIAERYRGDDATRPPYVPRDIDGSLEQALRDQRFVLLIGPAKSGKSRTAYEACVRLYPDSPLLIPATPERLPQVLAHLSELLGRAPIVDQAGSTSLAKPILWLDDAEQYLDAAVLTLRTLDEGPLSQGSLVVIATIRTEQYDRLIGTKGQIGQAARELLERTKVRRGDIRLSAQNSAQEGERAQRLYPDLELTLGIARSLAATEELKDRFLNGGGLPGMALVRAAADWRRAGVLRPIVEDDLKGLYRVYVPTVAPSAEITSETFEEGLQWARAPVSSGARLLTAVEEKGVRAFEVFDFIVSYIDQADGGFAPDGGAIPEETWTLALERVTPEEAYSVSLTANTRNNPTVAERAARKALDAPAQIAGAAASNLGFFLQQHGDLKGAEAAWRRGVKLQSGSAAYNLGILLNQRGDEFGAKAAFRKGVELRFGRAAYSLGVLFQDREDQAETEAAWRRGVELGSEDAAFGLGVLLEQRGDLAGAEAAYRQGVELGSGDAANELGVLLEQRGDQAGAEAAYRQGVELESGDAANNLGALLEQRGI
jgi:Flp pilus assembly protein TadD